MALLKWRWNLEPLLEAEVIYIYIYLFIYLFIYFLFFFLLNLTYNTRYSTYNTLLAVTYLQYTLHYLQ